MTQTALHLSAPEPDSIQARFEAFHAAHPEVYRTLRRLAREWARKHRGERCGMKMLWAVMRWELRMGDRSAEYALNNDYTSRYARLLMAEEPELGGLFETRQLRSA